MSTEILLVQSSQLVVLYEHPDGGGFIGMNGGEHGACCAIGE
jgi:hypothetical protein